MVWGGAQCHLLSITISLDRQDWATGPCEGMEGAGPLGTLAIPLCVQFTKTDGYSELTMFPRWPRGWPAGPGPGLILHRGSRKSKEISDSHLENEVREGLPRGGGTGDGLTEKTDKRELFERDGG